ncbi:MAG: hypothetical protein M9894_15690 [Planctomycetes bacterium]|nr:hypothetical protein [Planctomycetota bacterium]
MTPDWPALEREVAGVVDEAGTPIDEGIAPLVAALWAHGLTTEESCEGHVFDEPLAPPAYEDPAFGAFCPPYVAIAAASPVPHPMDLEPEDFARDPSLREYAARWRLANHHLQARLISLLERFYADRRAPYTVQLHVFNTHGEWGPCVLSSIGAEATRVLPRDRQVERLVAYQEELRAFSAFLRVTAP